METAGMTQEQRVEYDDAITTTPAERRARQMAERRAVLRERGVLIDG